MHKLRPQRPNPTWRSNQASSATALSAAQADAEQSRSVARRQIERATGGDRQGGYAHELSEQLNSILQTRDSARGLIVSMSDVLFDTGKYSLKPGAREKLAKVAGILLAYPGLNIEVGGYTDNVGGDAMNQTLSENRAGSVRDYLVQARSIDEFRFSPKASAILCRSLPTITPRDGSRTAESSFLCPATPSAAPSMQPREACSKVTNVANDSTMEATPMKLIGIDQHSSSVFDPRRLVFPHTPSRSNTTSRKKAKTSLPRTTRKHSPRNPQSKMNKVRSQRTRITSKKRKTQSSRARTISKKRKTRLNKRRTPSSKRTPSKARRTSRSRSIHNSRSLSNRSSTPATVAAAFPTIVTRPTLDRNTGSGSAKAITVIAASNTAAIGLDFRACGPATGSTRKTFM